jgi:hypothetical protein
LRSYRDSRVKENAWKEVARYLDTSVELAMKKWKSLRDRFVRELKKTKHRVSGDSGPPATSSWKYFEVLMFLADTMKHKR